MVEVRDTYEASMILDVTSEDGNVFAVIAKVSAYLRANGRRDEVEEYRQKATSSTYENAVVVSQEYCPDLRIVGYVEWN